MQIKSLRTIAYRSWTIDDTTSLFQYEIMEWSTPLHQSASMCQNGYTVQTDRVRRP